MFSKYKDVVYLLPTCRMSDSNLNFMLKKIIVGLEQWFSTCGEWQSCQVGNDQSERRTTASKFITLHPNVDLLYKSQPFIAVLIKKQSVNGKAANVMQLVDAFFKERLDWGKLVQACTDGAPAMLGVRSGFVKLLKQKNPKVVTLHCIIHREALASYIEKRLHHTLRSACIKDDDTTSQRST